MQKRDGCRNCSTNCLASEVIKMPRAKKDAKNLNIKLDRTIHERLDQFCEENGMSKTYAIEKILKKFFDEYSEIPSDEKNEKERTY